MAVAPPVVQVFTATSLLPLTTQLLLTVGAGGAVHWDARTADARRGVVKWGRRVQEQPVQEPRALRPPLTAVMDRLNPAGQDCTCVTMVPGLNVSGAGTH